MNSLRRFATKEPTVCAVCRRRAWSIGYAEGYRSSPLLWLCDNIECISLAKKVYRMKQQELDFFEMLALEDAGNEAGAYLDEINQTDLAKLTPEQWLTFRRRLVFGFGERLRHRLQSPAAPVTPIKKAG
jgi:hypothetical protein